MRFLKGARNGLDFLLAGLIRVPLDDIRDFEHAGGGRSSYLVVEIFCAPFRNQLLLKLSVAEIESATGMPHAEEPREDTDLANFILTVGPPSWHAYRWLE